MEKYTSHPDALDTNLGQESIKPVWKAPTAENAIHKQIEAYADHVLEQVEKTGKTKAEIIALEKEEIKKAGGIEKFLESMAH